MSEHTKEPWGWCVFSGMGRLAVPDSFTDIHGYVGIIKEGEKNVIASLDYHFDSNTTHANARRIVACVNACEGVPIKALEDAAECASAGKFGTMAAMYKSEADALQAENKRLREALEQISNYDNLMLCGFYAMKIAAAAMGKE
jgi:hypothetical protein